MIRNSFPQEKIRHVLDVVSTSEKSDFYRNHFASLPVPVSTISGASWESVPLLSREDIVSVTFAKRLFTDFSHLDCIRNTYGTSGRRILIMPRCFYGSYESQFGFFRGLRLMHFFAPCHFDFPRIRVEGTSAVFGDVGNLEISARIAKLYFANALLVTPYTALAFADLLDEYDVSRTIRVIMLTGERCSPLQFETLRKRYPNALIVSYYSSSECRESIAVSCEHERAAGRHSVVEAVPELYIEIIDPNSEKKILDYDVPGEIIVTTLDSTLPLPLIKYRTGDVGAYRRRECECERRKTGFEVVGRSNVFPVRLVKGELTISAMEAALAAVSGISPDYFEIHYTEEVGFESALPRVRVVVVGDPNVLKPQVIARTIEEHLRVFPTYTYAQGVEERLYLPITISIIEAPPPPKGQKRAMPFIMRHMAGSDEVQKISIEDAKKRL